MKKAIYAISGDPTTNGHVHILKRASSLFDEIIFVIADNFTKKYMFSKEERVQLAEDIVKREKLENVTVKSCENQFLVNFAKEEKVSYLVRGMRKSKDFEDESELFRENKSINPEVETVFFIADPDMHGVSSSLVRGMTTCKDWEQEVIKKVPIDTYWKLKIHKDEVWLRNYLSERRDIFGNLADVIITKLMEDTRFYHSVSHVVDLIKKVEELDVDEDLKGKLKDVSLFHDIIYDVNSQDNEKESAEFYSKFMDISHLDVEEAIKATALHDSKNELEEIFMDLDLSTLGANTLDYKVYMVGIRSEYAFVPWDVYKTERIKILNSFISRSKIYKTKHFSQLENQARANIQFEIEYLKKDLDPFYMKV